MGEGGPEEPAPSQAPSLAERLDRLFRTFVPAGRSRPYSAQEVADAINAAAGGQIISGAYLQYLRTGKRDKPAYTVLEGVAKFFGVSVLYFYDTEEAELITADLDVLDVLRDAKVRAVAFRMSMLDDEAKDLVATVVDMARRAKGLEGPEPA
jgi:transcriptional regulator with XRE-family HTH domain